MFLLSALFWGFLALLALGFLLWRFHRFLKWRRKTTLSLRDQLVILLPLLALALALTIPLLPAVFSTWPAKYAELKELTAPVESVQADSRTSSAGRGGRLETRTSYHVFSKAMRDSSVFPTAFVFARRTSFGGRGQRRSHFSMPIPEGNTPFIKFKRVPRTYSCITGRPLIRCCLSASFPSFSVSVLSFLPLDVRWGWWYAFSPQSPKSAGM